MTSKQTLLCITAGIISLCFTGCTSLALSSNNIKKNNTYTFSKKNELGVRYLLLKFTDGQILAKNLLPNENPHEISKADSNVYVITDYAISKSKISFRVETKESCPSIMPNIYTTHPFFVAASSFAKNPGGCSIRYIINPTTAKLVVL